MWSPTSIWRMSSCPAILPDEGAPGGYPDLLLDDLVDKAVLVSDAARPVALEGAVVIGVSQPDELVDHASNTDKTAFPGTRQHGCWNRECPGNRCIPAGSADTDPGRL